MVTGPAGDADSVTVFTPHGVQGLAQDLASATAHGNRTGVDSGRGQGGAPGARSRTEMSRTGEAAWPASATTIPKTNLCQAIRVTQGKGLMPDGTSRFSLAGKPLLPYMGCSTFANFTEIGRAHV